MQNFLRFILPFFGLADYQYHSSCFKREHNYAQQQFSGWEFSIESQTEGCKKPIMNIHYEYTLVEVNIH